MPAAGQHHVGPLRAQRQVGAACPRAGRIPRREIAQPATTAGRAPRWSRIRPPTCAADHEAERRSTGGRGRRWTAGLAERHLGVDAGEEEERDERDRTSDRGPPSSTTNAAVAEDLELEQRLGARISQTTNADHARQPADDAAAQVAGAAPAPRRRLLKPSTISPIAAGDQQRRRGSRAVAGRGVVGLRPIR